MNLILFKKILLSILRNLFEFNLIIKLSKL